MLRFAIVFSLLLIFTLGSAESSGGQAAAPTIALNSCFRYAPGIRLRVADDQVAGTESIQFKDDCLRACLRSQIRNVFTCRSLMHFPSDDDCLLATSDLEHATHDESADEFPPANTYENLCAPTPFKDHAITTAEARFNGYRGDEGLLKLAQSSSDTKALFLLDGVEEDLKFRVLHSHAEARRCYKLSSTEINEARQLFNVTTDSSGMAVFPWDNVSFDLSDLEGTKSTIIIVTDELSIVDCGELSVSTIHTAAASTQREVSTLLVALLVLVGFV